VEFLPLSEYPLCELLLKELQRMMFKWAENTLVSRCSMSISDPLGRNQLVWLYI